MSVAFTLNRTLAFGPPYFFIGLYLPLRDFTYPSRVRLDSLIYFLIGVYLSFQGYKQNLFSFPYVFLGSFFLFLCVYSITHNFGFCNIQIVSILQLFFVQYIDFVHKAHKTLYKTIFICYNRDVSALRHYYFILK